MRIGDEQMRITLTILILSMLYVGTSSAEPYAYIANSRSNNVVVIDVSTHEVVDTVGVGVFPQGVAVTPDGQLVYVVNESSDNVSVIDTLTNALIP